MRMTVADLMSEIPVTVGPECTTDEALDAFFEYETPELYVVDKSGRFLGVLPDYELLKAQLSGEARDISVEKLMSRAVPVVTVDSDAAEVARSFRDSRCGRIPVVKAGRLVGIVTRADVLRLMAVLRRIDGGKKKGSSGPKRPKMLGPSKSAPATSAKRTKSMNPKATTSPQRTKSAGKTVTRR